MRALVDSGNQLEAGVAISEDLAGRLGVKVEARSQQTVGTARKGQFLENVGRAEPIVLRLPGYTRSFVIRPVVLRGLSHPCNLGSAFLSHHGFTLKFSPQGNQLLSGGGNAELIASLERGPASTEATGVNEKPGPPGLKRSGRPAREPPVKALLGRPKTQDQLSDDKKCLQKSNPNGRGRVNDRQGGRLGKREGEPLRYPNFPLRILDSRQLGGETLSSLEVSCPRRFIPGGAVCIEGGDREGLQVIPGVYSINPSTGRTKIFVLNVHKHAYRIEPGAQICNGFPVKERKLTNDTGAAGKNLESMNETGCDNVQELYRDLKLDENPLLRKNPAIKRKVKALIYKYRTVFTNPEVSLGKTDLIKCKIRLRPGAVPVKAKNRPFNPAQTQELRKQVDQWRKEGVVEPSHSPWSSPLVPVRKRDGTTRWCVDLRLLNAEVVQDSYPLPRIMETLEKVRGSKIFSSLDACSAYQVIPMDEESKELTAFSTPFGLYHFARMPFGLKTAGAVYSRFIAMVLDPLGEEGIISYLDDILVHSKTLMDHLSRLEQVLKVHLQAGIKLKASKTFLFQEEIQYLGHQLNADGVGMIEEYIRKIIEWPTPTTVKELGTMLGFFSYYRNYVPDFATLTAEMNAQKKSKALVWTEKMQENLEELKRRFKGAPILAFPDYESPELFRLTTDYSSMAVSAILSQMKDGKERLIAAAGRKCTPYEANYSSWKGEMSALVYGLKKYEHLLRYRKFLVLTDASALRHLKTLKQVRGITARWLEFMQDFEFEVIHKPGKLNVNADCLSRAGHLDEPDPEVVREQEELVGAVSDQLQRDRLREAQRRDASLRTVRNWCRSGTIPGKDQLRGSPLEMHTYRKVCPALRIAKDGVLEYPVRLNQFDGPTELTTRCVIPEELWEEAFYHAHCHASAGHFGERATIKRAQRMFFWPGMTTYLVKKINSCAQCIKKVQKIDPRASEHVPRRHGYPMEQVFIDLVGPLPETAQGDRYILSVQDGYTKWLQAFPLKNKETSTVARVLLDNYISVWGCPRSIFSDQGKEFSSKLFEELMKELKIEKLCAPPYNPQSNNVERAHRVLNSMFRVFMERGDMQWARYLPAAVLAYNSKVHSSTGCTPHMALLAREATLPVDLVMQLPSSNKGTVGEYVQAATDRFRRMYKHIQKCGDAIIRRNANQYHGDAEKWEVGTQVWYFCPRAVPGKPKKLTSQWIGPYKITQRIAPVLVQIAPAHQAGRSIVTHVTRLRLYQGPAEPSAGGIPEDLELDDDGDEEGEVLRLPRDQEPLELGVPVSYGIPAEVIVDRSGEDRDAVEEQVTAGLAKEVQDVIPADPDPEDSEPTEEMEAVPTPGTAEALPATEEARGLRRPRPESETDPGEQTGQAAKRFNLRRSIKRLLSEAAEGGETQTPGGRLGSRKKPNLRDQIDRLLADSESEGELASIATIVVKIKSGAQKPVRATDGSAAYDVAATHSCTLAPGAVTPVDINLAVEVPRGYYLQLTSRSSWARRGLLVVGGVVDSDYRGQVVVFILNTTSSPVAVKPGDRVAQGLFLRTEDVNFKEVETLEDSTRGSGGFGSTGSGPLLSA